MIGNIKKRPVIDDSIPGAINNNDTIPKYHLWNNVTVFKQQPAKLTPIKAIPIIAEINVSKKIYKSKPWATNNNDGEYTNTNGTKAFAIPSLKAVFPVLNGFDPAIPAAAYAARATGGVISAKTP